MLFICVWEEKGCLNNMLLMGVKISRLWISSRKFTRRINKPTCRADIRHSSLSHEHLDHRLVSQIPVQKAQINAEETSWPNKLLGAKTSQSKLPCCLWFCLWLWASQFSSLYRIQIMIFDTVDKTCFNTSHLNYSYTISQNHKLYLLPRKSRVWHLLLFFFLQVNSVPVCLIFLSGNVLRS